MQSAVAEVQYENICDATVALYYYTGNKINPILAQI